MAIVRGDLTLRATVRPRRWGDVTEFENRTSHRKRMSDGREAWLTLLCVMTLLVGCHGRREQKFAMEPQDQSAIIGSRVTLPCRVEAKAGALQWTKDDFGLGTHRNLSGYERYSMIGSDDEGDYSLDIRDLSLDDDGRYQCQVSSGLNGEPAIRSRYAQLTVLVPPDPPRIVQGAFIDALEDRPVEIECISTGGKPASEITWLDGNQVVIKEDITNKADLLSDGLRYNTRSVLRLVPTKLHHNSTITCQAQNTADRAPRLASVLIEVKYAPKIEMLIKSGEANGKIKEGSEVRVVCKIDANPPARIYKWYINDRPVVGDYNDEMIIFNVTRKYVDAVVKCEVANSAGSSENTIALAVTYPPYFRSRPKDVEAEDGSTVTLKCDVDGRPKPEIRWILHEPGRIGQVKGKSSEIDIVVSNATAGRYICKATVEGYPDIEAEATIFIKSAPRIVSNRTQFGLEGDNARVVCVAHCVPKADDIRWYFEGKELILIENPDYAKLDEDLAGGIVKSSLVIRSSQAKHYGLYNCSITNDYGNDNAAILLKPLKPLPLFIVLAVVTSAIILVSALVILLIVCFKRRRNNNRRINGKPDVTNTMSDAYKESDRSSSISDLKVPHTDVGYELEYTSDAKDKKAAIGLPLAGPVSLPHIRQDYAPYRYSNDYTDPAYSDLYFKNHGTYVYDYPHGYTPPTHLRVQQSPTVATPVINRSPQGSLSRSVDSTSTAPVVNSRDNSLQRSTKLEHTDAINSLGLPIERDGPINPLYAQPHVRSKTGVDLRYAATYGNPYLRNSSIGYNNQINTTKPTSIHAPPPYSARNSMLVQQDTENQVAGATHV